MSATEQERQLLKHINLQFDEVRVFDSFSMHVPENRITCIVGPSGCGKTSILNLLAGFIDAFDGMTDTADERIGYIFQEDRLLPWETVYQNVNLVRPVEDRKEIMSLLQALELDGFADKYPHQLSGGMRQRCAIARGFYYHSTLLLMDEPFKSLDYDLRLNMIRYLGRLWEKNRSTVIFVTHDIDEALLLGHRVIVLSRRPTEILEVYDQASDLSERDISLPEHIRIRSRIINHMSNNAKKREGNKK